MEVEAHGHWKDGLFLYTDSDTAKTHPLTEGRVWV